MINKLSNDFIYLLISFLETRIDISTLEEIYEISDYISNYNKFNFLQNKINQLNNSVKNNIGLFNFFQTSVYFSKFNQRKYNIKLIKISTDLIDSNIPVLEYPILSTKSKKIFENISLINNELCKFQKIDFQNSSLFELGCNLFPMTHFLHINPKFTIIELLYLLNYVTTNNLICKNVCCSGKGLIISK